MMDVVSQISPAGSVSPPISPIKFVHPTSSLPPVRNIPTWNRTSLGHGRTKVLTSITKDIYSSAENELGIQNLSKSTQTSPPPNHDRNNHSPSVNKSGISSNSSGIDKKLIFIQTRHEDILNKLHSEVERLKNENKDKAASANPAANKSSERLSTSKHTSSAVRSSARKKDEKLEEVKVILLKEEVHELKNALRDARSKNAQLSHTTHAQKQRTKSGSTSAKTVGNFGHQPVNKFPYQNPPLPPVETNHQQQRKLNSPPPTREPDHADILSQSSSANDRTVPSAEYQKMIRHLQQMNAKQAHELNKFRNKYETQKRQSIEDIQRRTEDRLPKLPPGNVSKSARITETKYGKNEGIVLPALRPTVGQKLADRKRKAQAMHVQRQQRSNKEFSQKLL